MEREKNNTANLELEILGNYFITGHSFIEEQTPCRAWVFATSKKKQTFYNAEPYKSPCKLSMMSVSSNPLMLEKTVDNIVKKNLQDSLFDENGQFEYYRVAKVWRDSLEDESVLSDLETATVEDFATNGDPKRLREINARLLKALSVNPEYVATLRQNIESFMHASKKLAVHVYFQIKRARHERRFGRLQGGRQFQRGRAENDYLGGNGAGVFHRLDGTSHEREDYDGRIYQKPV